MKKIFFILLFLPFFVFAFDKNNFQFYKKFEIEKPGIYYFDFDEDIESKVKNVFSDLGIFSDSGKEIKFKIKKEKDFYKTEVLKTDLNFQKIGKNIFLVDLKNPKKEEYLNNIFLNSQNKSFRRKINVWGAYFKNGPWFKIDLEDRKKMEVFDVPGKQKFQIDFKYSNYAFLKIKFFGDQGSFQPNSFYKILKKNTLIPGEKKRIKVFPIEEFDKNKDGKKQTYIFDLEKKNIFIDEVNFLFANKNIVAKYIFYASDSPNSEILKDQKDFQKNKKYWIKVSEGRIENFEGDAPFNLKIKNNKRFYRLDLWSEKRLSLNFAFFEKFKKKIFFKIKEAGNFGVFYAGNNEVENQKFELDLKEEEILKAKKIVLAKEEKNKNYQKNKKSFFDSNVWFIYFLGVVLIFIILFFIFKLIRENRNKTKKDEIKI